MKSAAGLIDIRDWNTAGRGQGIWQVLPAGCQEGHPLSSTLEEEPVKHYMSTWTAWKALRGPVFERQAHDLQNAQL